MCCAGGLTVIHLCFYLGRVFLSILAVPGWDAAGRQLDNGSEAMWIGSYSSQPSENGNHSGQHPRFYRGWILGLLCIYVCVAAKI